MFFAGDAVIIIESAVAVAFVEDRALEKSTLFKKPASFQFINCFVD